MTSYVELKSHDTPADLYANLSRVFGEKESSGYRWVEFTHDGIKLTFFAPKDGEVPA